MLKLFTGAVLAFCFAVLLSSCAAVDQFGGRVYDSNTNTQRAMNEELLLNILRASQYQSTNFMGIAQVTGTQSEQLTTGLPTALFGPLTAAQQVYSLSNAVQSGVTGGYQATPLITTAFQNGMLSPVSARTLALLINSHPREIVFFAILEAIVVTDTKTKEVTRLTNEPDANDDSFANCQKVRTKIFPGEHCTYSKFANLLEVLSDAGLSAELIEATSNTSAQTTATSTATSAGRFCMDPTLTTGNRIFTPTCMKVQKASPGANETKTITIIKKTTGSGKEDTMQTQTSGIPAKAEAISPAITYPYPGLGQIEVTFIVRSPSQVFNYLGAWYRNRGHVQFPPYLSGTALAVLRSSEPYLNIIEGSGPECYVSAYYAGNPYCIPHGSYHTAMLLDILESLRNLNITPTDLNSAFTVRLSP